MNALPKISIVTPSFNQGKYIEKTLKSIINQGYLNLEYIVIDGGSTDNTVDIIKKYEKDIDYWISEPDKGQMDAIKKGFDIATGDFFLWVNSDDYLLPDAIHKLVAAHNESPSADIIVGLGRRSDTKGKITYSDIPIDEVTMEFLLNWMEGPWFCQPSSMFSRRVWETCGPFDERFHVAFDLDFWIKAKKAGFVYKVVNDYLSIEIFHNRQKTAQFRNHTIVEIAVIIIKYGGEDIVRGYLDEMAQKLIWYETIYNSITNKKIFTLYRKFSKTFLKKYKQKKYKDTCPTWLK